MTNHHPVHFAVPVGARVTACKTCGDTVAIYRTPAGREMPVNIPQREVLTDIGERVAVAFSGQSHLQTCETIARKRRRVR